MAIRVFQIRTTTSVVWVLLCQLWYARPGGTPVTRNWQGRFNPTYWSIRLTGQPGFKLLVNPASWSSLILLTCQRRVSSMICIWVTIWLAGKAYRVTLCLVPSVHCPTFQEFNILALPKFNILALPNLTRESKIRLQSFSDSVRLQSFSDSVMLIPHS